MFSVKHSARISLFSLCAFFVGASSLGWGLVTQLPDVVEEIETIPLERLIKNLEGEPDERGPRKLEKDFGADFVKSAEAQRHYSIGRFYALAYALGQTEFRVTKETTSYSGHVQSVKYKYDGDQNKEHLPPSDVLTNSKLLARRKASQPRSVLDSEGLHRERFKHLDIAIHHYTKALELEPQNLFYRLAGAWALGQRLATQNEAFVLYRNLFEECVRRRHQQESPGESFFDDGLDSVINETAQYLIDHLEPNVPENRALILQCKNEIRKHTAGSIISPIFIPLLEETSFDQLVNLGASIKFNFSGFDETGLRPWITPHAGWLVWDPQNRGEIKSGRQLFGNVTFWNFWPNGYSALSALDDNADGEISGSELPGLAIWRDVNRNAISEPGEVAPVSEWNIESISWSHEEHPAGYWSPQGVKFGDGSIKPSYDWFVPDANRK